jgi:hypothetical protein
MSGLFATLGPAQPAAGGHHTVQRIKRETMDADIKGGSS